MVEEVTLVASTSIPQCLVGRVSGGTKRIRHGTVLADWSNTRTDSVPFVAGSLTAAAGPGIDHQALVRNYLRLVSRHL